MARYASLLLFLLSSWAYFVFGDPICDEDACSLPDCYCNPLKIPGDLKAKNTPQMILVSYTGAVNEDTRKQINSVFPVKMKNPNGCPIAITLFVTGKFTDYCEVHQLYVRGHEVATQGFNSTYTGDWTKQQWEDQMVGHRDKLRKSAHIPEEHISGARAPLNRPGGDKMYSMLAESNFLYDATMLGGPVKWNDTWTDKSIWPMTLYATWERCQTPDCPLSSYPTLWEIPITRILVDANTSSCAFLDECASVESTTIEKLLKKNFERSYLGNRAPFQINLQARAFFNRRLVTDLSTFMTNVMMYDDVWFVTYQVGRYNVNSYMHYLNSRIQYFNSHIL